MADKKAQTIKPIIFDEEPYNVLCSLNGSGSLKSVDDEKLGDSLACFVLKVNSFYGIPSWDKGDPDKGILPKADFWTQMLFVPTFATKADNKLYNKVSDRTVCQMFKRGRHLASFTAASKTTRREETIENTLDSLGIDGLQAWQLVVWYPEFVGKSNKHGSYSAMRWFWALPQEGQQQVTYQRIVQMYKDYGINPLELEYEVDPNLLYLDSLDQDEKREFKRLISRQNAPSLQQAASTMLSLPGNGQAPNHQ